MKINELFSPARSDWLQGTFIHTVCCDSLLSASSHPIGTQQFGIDYDLILRNVKELNILAGEGQHVIQHTLSGAKLKVIPEYSPTTTGGIKLYAVLTRVCSLSGG